MKKSEEHVKKISEANKGKKASLETRAKMSAAQKGKKLSEEHKAILLEANRNLSEERRAAISGHNSARNKFYYIFSNGTDYWSIPSNERISICKIFRLKNIDVITYKGVTITRINKKDYKL